MIKSQLHYLITLLPWQLINDLLMQNVWLKEICILIGITLIVKLNYIDYNKNFYSFKITNFTLNKIIIIAHLCLVSYLIIKIHTAYLDKEINIKDLIIKLKTITIASDTLNTIMLRLLLIVVIISVILVIKNIYYVINKEYKKSLLYFLYDGSRQSYNLRLLLQEFTIEEVYNEIIIDQFLKKIGNFFHLSNNIYVKLEQISKYIIFKFPGHFICYYFVYEIVINNMILSTRFNKCLFFFIFYSLWQKISDFHWNNDFHINKMVADMYYRTYSIKYGNLPGIWKYIIFNYVYDDLYRNRESSLNSTQDFDLNLGFNRIITIQINYTFYSVDGKLYTNAHGESFIEPIMATQDVFPKCYR